MYNIICLNRDCIVYFNLTLSIGNVTNNIITRLQELSVDVRNNNKKN